MLKMNRLKKKLFMWLTLIVLLTVWTTAVFAKEITVEETIQICLEENSTLKNLHLDLEKSGIHLEGYKDVFRPQLQLKGNTGYNYDFSKQEGMLNVNVRPSVNWLLTPDTNLNISLKGLSLYRPEDAVNPQLMQGNINSLSLSHLVYGGDEKWESGLRSQKLAYLSAEIQLQEQKSAIIYQVIKNYYEVVKCVKLIDLQKEALNRTEDHLEKVTAFYEAGQVSKLELLNAQVQVNQDLSALKSAENALVLAKMQLNLLLGNKLPEESTFVSKIEMRLFPYTLDEVMVKAEENSLKLVLLNQQLEVQKEEYQRLLKLKAPDVYLKGNYDWDDKMNDGDFLVAVEATYEPFSGQENQYDLDSNLLEQAKLQEMIENEKNSLRTVVQSKFLNLAAITDDLQVQESLMKKYIENLEIAKFRYESGLTNDSEVLDYQVNLLQVEKTYYGGMVDYQLNVVELLQLLGDQL